MKQSWLYVLPLIVVIAGCSPSSDRGDQLLSTSGTTADTMTDTSTTRPIVDSVIGEIVSLSHLTLVVRDLEMMTERYRDILGFDIIDHDDAHTILGHEKTPFLTLTHQKDYQTRLPSSAGLYHIAYLHRTQTALAKRLAHVLATDPASFQGSADHLVSEAFYFGDPEGNGIELYFDRDPSTRQRKDGNVVMGSEYLDPRLYIQQHDTPTSYDSDTRIGHIHLQVGDLAEAKAFYVDTIGFDIVSYQAGRGALFVSAGGYHHHIGLNIRNSRGAGPRPADQYGLGSLTITLPTQGDYDALVERLQESEIYVENDNQTLTVFDPWNNRLMFTVQS